MESSFKYNDVETMLCIWECALTDRRDYLMRLKGFEGMSYARGQVIEQAHHFDKIYDIAKDMGFDDSFDWEFVPRVIKFIMREDAELHAKMYQKCAFFVMQDYMVRMGHKNG